MTTEQTTTTDDESIDDKLPLDMRTAAEALARPRWEREEYDIDNVEEWDDLAGGHYPVDEFDVPQGALGHVRGSEFLHVEFEPEHFDRTRFGVFYTADCVQLDVQAEGDAQAGMLAKLSPGEAIELAAMLCQGAIEQSRRQKYDSPE